MGTGDNFNLRLLPGPLDIDKPLANTEANLVTASGMAPHFSGTERWNKILLDMYGKGRDGNRAPWPGPSVPVTVQKKSQNHCHGKLDNGCVPTLCRPAPTRLKMMR